jgi:hypothetical protein
MRESMGISHKHVTIDESTMTSDSDRQGISTRYAQSISPNTPHRRRLKNGGVKFGCAECDYQRMRDGIKELLEALSAIVNVNPPGVSEMLDETEDSLTTAWATARLDLQKQHSPTQATSSGTRPV